MDASSPVAVASALVLQGGYLKRPIHLEQRSVDGRCFVKVLASDTISALANFFISKTQVLEMTKGKPLNHGPPRIVRSWPFWRKLRLLRRDATLAARDQAADGGDLNDLPLIDLGLDRAPKPKRRRVQLPLGDAHSSVLIDITEGTESLTLRVLQGQGKADLWIEFQPQTFQWLFNAFKKYLDAGDWQGFGQGDDAEDDDDEEDQEEDEDEEEADADEAGSEHGHQCSQPRWYESRCMWIVLHKARSAPRWTQKSFSVKASQSAAVFQERKTERLAKVLEWRKAFLASASGSVSVEVGKA